MGRMLLEVSGPNLGDLDISDSLYNRVPLIYLAQLCLVFEKIKNTWNFAMLSIELLKPQQSWSPGPCIRYQNVNSQAFTLT